MQCAWYFHGAFDRSLANGPPTRAALHWGHADREVSDLIVVILMVGDAGVQRLPLDAQDLLNLVRAHVLGAICAPPAQHAVAVLCLPARPRRKETGPWQWERPLQHPSTY